jgi:isopentenyl-diphosphate Delta-isomerase
MAIEKVILVDEQDNVIGEMEKMEAHQKGLLHRAFSVLVFNEYFQLLLHRRALGKYHSPGLWTNTCCSHPRIDENIASAGHRRLMEEMGFDCPLTEIFSFTYRASFDNGLIEHELDHVFVGIFNGIPEINPDEVAEYKWASLEEIEQNSKEQPADFTEWFKILLPKLREWLDSGGKNEMERLKESSK